MRICIPITAATTAEALLKMEQGFGLADILELRIDGIRKVDLEKLLAGRKGELIVTNRVKEEGGAFIGGEQERVALLTKAVALGSDYVDLEIRTEEALVLKLKKKIEAYQGRTRLILSYHNLERTPSLKDLRKKIEEGQKAGADIIKIVPQARQDGRQSQGPISHPLCPKKRSANYSLLHGGAGKDQPGHGPAAGFLSELRLFNEGGGVGPGANDDWGDQTGFQDTECSGEKINKILLRVTRFELEEQNPLSSSISQPVTRNS